MSFNFYCLLPGLRIDFFLSSQSFSRLTKLPSSILLAPASSLFFYNQQSTAEHWQLMSNEEAFCEILLEQNPFSSFAVIILFSQK